VMDPDRWVKGPHLTTGRAENMMIIILKQDKQ